MYSESSSDEEVFRVAALLADAEEEEKRKKMWVHPINQKRSKLGEFHHLFNDLKEDEEKFFKYFRMTPTKFFELLQILESEISYKNTSFRRAISKEERLAVALSIMGKEKEESIATTSRSRPRRTQITKKESPPAVRNIRKRQSRPSPSRSRGRPSKSATRKKDDSSVINIPKITSPPKIDSEYLGRRSTKINLEENSKKNERTIENKAPELRRSSRKTPLENDHPELAGSEDEFIPKEKPKATVRGRTRGVSSAEPSKDPIRIEPVTLSSNFALTQLKRRKRDSISKSLAEFSDDEEAVKLDTVTESSTITFSSILSLIMHVIFPPLFTVCLHVFCNKTHCSFTSLPDLKTYASFAMFFDIQSFLGYSVLVISTAILSVLPFCGSKVINLPTIRGKITYVANGFFCLLILSITCGVLEYLEIPVFKFIAEHVLHFLTAATIYGLLFSVFVCIKSYYAPFIDLNPSEVKNNWLSGFLAGREINPRLLNILDFKMYFMRICFISLIFMNVAFLIKGLNLYVEFGPAIANHNWKPLLSHPTLLVLVILQTIYSLDCLLLESRALSSYFFQYEALGYSNIMGLLLFPFILITQTYYVVEYKVNLATWELLLLSAVHISGYLLYRLSNNQKDSFRRNPYSSAMDKMESISTSRGKKLLCSGYWGFVRQPNMLGDLLMHGALVRFSCHAPSVLGLLLILLMLIQRAVNSQAFCKQKYESDWDKYCSKVKYILIPKVF